MGHGYFAVVGYGILLKLSDIINYYKSINQIKLNDKSGDKLNQTNINQTNINQTTNKESNENYDLNYETESETEFELDDEYDWHEIIDNYETEYKDDFEFHYDCQSRMPDEIFITLKKKFLCSDARGCGGYGKLIDVKKLKPNEEEINMFCDIQNEIVGDIVSNIEFLMYSYEGP